MSQKNNLTLGTYIASLAGVSLLVFGGLILIFHLLKDGLYPLASATGAIVIFLSLVFLRKQFTPYRWLAIGIVFVALFTIYPIISTLLISFTNMSGGHLITKQQAIHRLESKNYLPEEGKVYAWTAYRENNESFLLLIEDEEGNYYIARQGQSLESLGKELNSHFDPDADGIPGKIGSAQRILKKEVVSQIETLGTISFGPSGQPLFIKSLREAAERQQKYLYDISSDQITDQETGEIYTPIEGTFLSDSGEKLIPGFSVNIGARNYSRFLSNPGYRKPIGKIIVWNITFAGLSVLISFFLGMVIAIIFDDLPGKRIIRTLLIIPYPIPVLVSITVWRGLLNESMGLISTVLGNLFGESPHFFTDQYWAKVALILINVYLSYPYFYILASGAIRSISRDIYEAADIDGASTMTKVRTITLPLILRILAPLLIASFSFNFNNFTLIWGFNAGLPAMADTIVPMGYTDLLISFVYRLGFSTANASNYGFAAAITVLLFLFVASMVFIQLRSTNALKEVQ